MNPNRLPDGAAMRASFWFFFCGCLQKGASLLTTPVFTRIMTETEYGRYSIYGAWFHIAQILVSLNLAAGVYTRGLIKNEADEDRFSSSLLGLSSLSAAVWGVLAAAVLAFAGRGVDGAAIFASAMLAEIWATAVWQFWSNRERVHLRVGKLVLLTAVYAVLRPLFGILFVRAAGTSGQAEARAAAGALCCLLLFLVPAVRIFSRGRAFYVREYWLWALRFNLPLLPHYLAQIVLNQSDRVMIGRIEGAGAAAYYSLACSLAAGAQIFTAALSSVLNPWIYRSLRDGKADRIGRTAGSVLWVAAASCFAVTAAAPELLSVFGPERYRAALPAVAPVTVGLYFLFLYNLFAAVEFHYEKTGRVMAASVTGALLNVALNAVFIPRFGFVAAGYTTLVCNLVYVLLLALFLRRTLREAGAAPIYRFRRIAPPSLALIAGCAAVRLLTSRPIPRYLLIAGCIGALWVLRERLRLPADGKNGGA